jgi:hypothetical protein
LKEEKGSEKRLDSEKKEVFGFYKQKILTVRSKNNYLVEP